MSRSVFHKGVGTIPNRSSAAYKIAALIHEHGPLTEAEIFHQVEFNPRASNRLALMRTNTESGWLVLVGRKIGIGDRAKAHFDKVAAEAPDAETVFIGQIAAPRDTGNVYTRPPLSKRHIPSSRGFRGDVPEFSVRQGQSFYTKA